jgi:hypothetical protein
VCSVSICRDNFVGDDFAVVVERGIHRCEELRDKGSEPAYVSVKTLVSKRSMMRACKNRVGRVT